VLATKQTSDNKSEDIINHHSDDELTTEWTCHTWAHQHDRHSLAHPTENNNNYYYYYYKNKSQVSTSLQVTFINSSYEQRLIQNNAPNPEC